MSKYAYQLYSSRQNSLEQAIKMVAECGYSAVEGYEGIYSDPAGLRQLLDKSGLIMPSGHFSVDMVESDPDGASKTAETLGIGTIYCPYLNANDRPKDADGWHAFGERLQKLAGIYKPRGFDFGWHNHDFEFQALADGTLPLSLIFDAGPDLSWEADIAWIVRGGADAHSWLDTYKDRLTGAHIKDIAVAGQCVDEDGWSDVGHGTMDWPGLLDQLGGTSCKHFIVEHDKPNDDQRFARRSIEALRQFGN